MELYHLTAQDEDVIDAIADRGLRPSSSAWSCWSPQGDLAAEVIGDVVWLIDDPTFKQWEGLLEPIGRADLWRVVCAIPAQDQKLIRFRDCLPGLRVSRLIHHTWLYAGVVPPRWIKAIEFLGSSQSNWYWRESASQNGDEFEDDLSPLQQRIAALEKGEDWPDVNELEGHLELLQASDEAQLNWTRLDDLQDRLRLHQLINKLEQADEAA